LSTLTVGGSVDLTVSTGRPDVVVPYVIGDDKETARQKLIDIGLRVKLVKQTSDQDQGTVVRTTPNPADSVSTGSLVTVYYSTGPTQVPNVVGLDERSARARLRDAGFRVDAVTDTTTVAQKGTVIRQSPSASTAQPQGTTVVITVSGYETPSTSPTSTTSPTTPPPSPGLTTSPSASPTG
jgi:beta-lactam-binding protein with PASTA domain